MNGRVFLGGRGPGYLRSGGRAGFGAVPSGQEVVALVGQVAHGDQALCALDALDVVDVGDALEVEVAEGGFEGYFPVARLFGGAYSGLVCLLKQFPLGAEFQYEGAFAHRCDRFLAEDLDGEMHGSPESVLDVGHVSEHALVQMAAVFDGQQDLVVGP